MRLREREYLGSKQGCLRILKNFGAKEITSLASASGVPIVILCLWYLEDIKDDETVRKQMKRCIDFYGYDTIERVETSEDS